MRYLWLGLALVIALVSVLVGRFLGFSRDAIALITLVLTWLVLFPFVKPYAPKLKFSVWALTAVIGAAVGGGLFYAFR